MQTTAANIDQIVFDIEARNFQKGKKIILNLPEVAGEVPLLDILQFVAAGCDGARSEDQSGFCRDDLRANVHGLISYLESGNTRVTFNGYEWILRMCVYYQRQWLPFFAPDTLAQVKDLKKQLPDHWR